MFKKIRPLHQTIERCYSLEKDSMKEIVDILQTKYQLDDKTILTRAEECAFFCIENKTDFLITFNMYISCLQNPKLS